jgi:UDP-glucose 4-epimerase
VREIIKLVCAVAEQTDIVASEVGYRAGDPAFLCADVSLLNGSLSFSAKYFLEASLKSLY